MKLLFKLTASAALACGAVAAGAVTFEDWGAPQVSAGGTFDNQGNYYITDPSKRWAVNNWDAACNAVLAGPNRCYATGSNKLYMHAEQQTEVAPKGDGFLFASINQIAFTNGMVLEVPLTPACYRAEVIPGHPVTPPPSSCGWNIGIYESEYNYRSLGIRSDGLGGGGLQMNIWGPCYEANFDGVDHGSRPAALPPPTCPLATYDPPMYASVPTPELGTYVLKMQYWNASGNWRWDYFVNGTWVAGHWANPDNEYYMGPGHYPGKAARIQLGAFNYTPRPSSWPADKAWNGSDGTFGTVSYTTF